MPIKTAARSAKKPAAPKGKQVGPTMCRTNPTSKPADIPSKRKNGGVPGDQPLAGSVQFGTIRVKLLQRRQEILNTARAAMQRQVAARHANDRFSDDVDVVSADVDKDIEMSIQGQNRTVLYRIEESLRRLSTGDYGICEDCDEPIPVRRLEAMPFALRCVGCQEEAEEMDRAQAIVGAGSALGCDD